MTFKTKTIKIFRKRVNLLYTYERKKVSYEAILRLVRQFLEEKKGNYYSKTITDMIHKGLESRYENYTRDTTNHFLTQSLLEMLEYLNKDLKITYYDKEMSEITIYHRPFMKSGNEQ